MSVTKDTEYVGEFTEFIVNKILHSASTISLFDSLENSSGTGENVAV